MSVSFNKIILVGRLGADAAKHQSRSKGGDGFLTFSMAVDNMTKKNGETVKLTDWFKCMIWGRERLKPYLTKGRMVLVEGAVGVRRGGTRQVRRASRRNPAAMRRVPSRLVGPAESVPGLVPRGMKLVRRGGLELTGRVDRAQVIDSSTCQKGQKH